MYSIKKDNFPNYNHECLTLGETIWLLQHRPIERSSSNSNINESIEKIIIIPENSGEITGYDEDELHFRAFDGTKSELLTTGYCYYERRNLESSFYDRFRPEYVKYKNKGMNQ